MRVLAGTPGDFLWLQERTGCALTSDFNAVKAIDARGKTRGVVGYCNWTHNSVQLHMAVDAPVAWRSLLRPALQYPFEERGMEICLGIIPADNKASVRFASVVGFREVHRVKCGWSRTVDLLVLELRRADCRYLFEETAERMVA